MKRLVKNFSDGIVRLSGVARFNLTGGSIENVANHSVCLAARAGSPVTMPLIFEAARSEFRKPDKPVNEAEFRLIHVVEAKA